MTMKTLLSTASLALLLASAATTSQAPGLAGASRRLFGCRPRTSERRSDKVSRTPMRGSTRTAASTAAKVNVDTVDYGYQVPRAIAQYKKWSGSDKVAAILGWGTADTEALTGFLAEDKIPDISASYAAALSDPTGAGGKAKPAPYNFFYGPSYSDAVRGMLTWAAEDWKAKGKPGKPKFVHMGANHPYPNAPKAAGEAIAAELGFETAAADRVRLDARRLQRAVPDPEELGRQLRLSRQHRRLEHLRAQRLQGGRRRRAVPRQRLGHGRERRQGRRRCRRWRGVPAAHRGGVGRQRTRHEDLHGNLQDVGRGRYHLPSRALHRRRLHRALHEGSRRMGCQERRRHRRERQEGLLPEEGLGAGRHGRRLQSLDLDRQRITAARSRSISIA